VGGLTAQTSGPHGRWIRIAVGITLIQAVLALLTRTQPLLGVPLTAAAGMSPAAVGQLASATSFGSMLYYLWGTAALGSLGAARQLRTGCLLAGVAILLSLSGSWAMMLVAALLIGIGYGPSAPAGSDILIGIVPRHRRGLVFSVKQAGVPLGGLLAGLLLPAALLWGGVGAALSAAAGLAFAAALVLGYWFREPGPARRMNMRALLTPAMLARPVAMFRLVNSNVAMRTITLAALGLAVAQGVLMSYFPVFLIAHAHISLTAAGALFALLQGFGIVGRIAAGWFSDRIGSPIATLMGAGLLSSITMVLLACLGPDSPMAGFALVAALAGICVVSWNGVFLAGLAALAPEAEVGNVTSAGTLVVFLGYVLSPLLLQGVLTLTKSYPVGFAVAALAPLLSAAYLLNARR
jgi:MFS family permease